MIAGYSSDQVRAAEAPHLAAGEPLMARAAAGLARELRALDPARMLVLAGSGDNGGDALFAAAELAATTDIAIVATGSRMHEPGLHAALQAGAHVSPAAEAAALAAAADVVLDGIVGTGSSAGLRGTALAVVAAVIAARPRFVVAVDLPSGIGPSDGAVPDPTVLHADLTVTFGAYKAGLLIHPGADHAGRVVLVDIGLGRDFAAMDPVVTVP